MNRPSTKLCSILAIILFIVLIPIAVHASNENVSIIETQNEENKQEYIIYINGYTEKNFKYAFSNDANPEIMDLIYINSITTNVEEGKKENQVAFLDANSYENLSKDNKTIYMWAKDESENLILEGIQLDFQKSLTKENIDSVETMTKRIKTNISETQDSTKIIKQENVDGVEETVSVGFVEITDNNKATYFNDILKVSNSEDYSKLMQIAEKMQNEYDSMDMYEKTQTCSEFYNLYNSLLENANWKEVENMIIYQPEDSVAGDKYIILLKKVDRDGEIVDIQFLTCFDDYKPNTAIEKKITQETAKLPITYDSMLLIVIFAVIVIALIVIYVRIKKLNKKDEQ